MQDLRSDVRIEEMKLFFLPSPLGGEGSGVRGPCKATPSPPAPLPRGERGGKTSQPDDFTGAGAGVAPGAAGGATPPGAGFAASGALPISGRWSHFSPSTALLSQPSHSSSSVAYTWRKSVWYFRSPESRSLRLGCLPTSPPCADGPATNRHDAAPWSVPRLPFSCTRRPNSENVITTVRDDWSPSVSKNEPTALLSSAIRFAWSSACRACVS